MKVKAVPVTVDRFSSYRCLHKTQPWYQQLIRMPLHPRLSFHKQLFLFCFQTDWNNFNNFQNNLNLSDSDSESPFSCNLRKYKKKKKCSCFKQILHCTATRYLVLQRVLYISVPLQNSIMRTATANHKLSNYADSLLKTWDTLPNHDSKIPRITDIVCM